MDLYGKTSVMSMKRISRMIGLGALLAGLLTACRTPPPGVTAYADGVAGVTPGQAVADWEDATVRRAEAVDGQELYTSNQSWNLPGANASLNDAARMLAGLGPVRPSDGYADVRQTSAWRAHHETMNKLWRDFEWRHETPIRQWAAREIPDIAGAETLFYPFSGPDFLFAQAFFPQVQTVVMCGLEPAEVLPVMSNLSPAEVSSGLSSLRTAINSVMQFSFFITKDMRNDLQSSRFRGVLPILMVFMARSGYAVESVDAIQIAADGSPVIVAVENGSAPGLLIRARAPSGALVRVFYVRQNLADDSLNPAHPFLAFVRQVAPGPAFTKSASYLMHESYFSTIRNHLLQERPALVQDPSGVPYRNFDLSVWDLKLYGNYQRTLGLFGDKAQQPDLAQAYAERRHRAQPLPFGIGYLYQPEATCLMVGRRGR
jgi:hypothetical protein